MSSSKWISFLLGCAIIHVWGGGPIGSYRVQKFDNVQCLLQFFQQCHCQKSNNFFSSTISVMPLLQINCNNFFISYFDNAIVTIFFFCIVSAMSLPQTHCNKFFSLLFRQCHCHKSIATFFFLEMICTHHFCNIFTINSK